MSAIISLIVAVMVRNDSGIALVAALIVFAISFGSFIYKCLVFHRVSAFGVQIHHGAQINDDFMKRQSGYEDVVSYKSIGSSRYGVSLFDITSSKGKYLNKIEFDENISNYLLSGRIIKIEARDGDAISFNEKEIMNNNERFKEIQMIAFSIKRRHALEGGKSFFDAEKISLGNLEFDKGDEQWKSEIGKTTYFCSVVTNDIVACGISRPHEPAIDRRSLDFYPANRNGDHFELNPFRRRTGLSNHLGSMVLAISADGIPLFCRQEKAAVQNSDKFVVSGAGSIDLEDLYRSGADRTLDLCDIIRFGMSRELLEEMQIVFQDSHRLDDVDKMREYMKNITVGGFYRDIRRGAFPIFFGFCRMQETYLQIIQEKDAVRCFNRSPKETTIATALPTSIVHSVSDLIAYIDGNLLKTEPGDAKREVSDQIIIYRRLLENETVRRHAEKAFGWEPGGSATPPAS